MDVLKKVVAIAQKHQLTVATQVYDATQSKIAKDLGFNIITPINDSALFEQAIKERLEAIKKIV